MPSSTTYSAERIDAARQARVPESGHVGCWLLRRRRPTFSAPAFFFFVRIFSRRTFNALRFGLFIVPGGILFGSFCSADVTALVEKAYLFTCRVCGIQ